MQVEIPRGLDWEIWRIASSDKFSASLDEICTRWSVEDLLDAHIALDLLEYAESQVAARSEAGS